MAGAIAIKGRTLVEKIAAKASGRADARAGDLVTADVDLCFAHDSSGPRRWAPMLAATLGSTASAHGCRCTKGQLELFEDLWITEHKHPILVL